ncbi:MAG: hypothetical protein MJY76_04610 [Bacteroidales bacterium]|nr:hypothetical protein [Bacteroidales bacterium]
MNKSIRQKHCGTAVGLTPKPAFTARSAAWSCKGLRLRFRRCQSFRFKETGVLNTYQLKGIEHDSKKYTIDYQVVTKQGVLNTPDQQVLSMAPKNAGNQPRFFTISVFPESVVFTKRQGLCTRSWHFCARFRYFRTRSSLFGSTLYTLILQNVEF